MKNVKFSENVGKEITLLIGCNVPEAHWVLEQRISGREQPFATTTLMGWVMHGPTDRPRFVNNVSTFTSPTQNVLDKLTKFYDEQLADPCEEDYILSRNDRAAILTVENSSSIQDSGFKNLWLKGKNSFKYSTGLP